MWPEDRHIEIIRLRLQQGGVRNERLLAELTDHVCCYLERQEGDDFEVLLDQGFFGISVSFTVCVFDMTSSV